MKWEKGNFRIRDYVKEYEIMRKDFLDYKVFQGTGDEYAKTTFTTWKVTINRIADNRKCGQLALNILNIVAYLMPEKIRREMFLSLAGGSEEQLKSSVDLLVEYSMVNDEKEQGMLSIHRLVQEVTRLNLKTEQDREEKVLREALELIKEPSLKEGDIAHVASILNYASRHDKLIADPGFDRTYGEYQYTSLCLLIRFNQGEKAVKHLINNIRRMKYPSMLIRFVNSADNLGHSPLRLAIENGNLNIVKYLIENGADYDSLSENDMTLLHIAASCGQLEVVKYLVADRGANIEAKDSDGMTPLHTAASRGSIELAKYFVTKRSNVNEKSYKGYTPLHLAAERGFLDTVKYLIKEGADLGAKDHKGYTPLHLAAERGFLDIVEYLINKGASYDIEFDYKWTLLHFFAREGNLDGIKLLVEKNDKYVRDYFINRINKLHENQGTVLDMAAQCGHLEIVRLLRQKGASILGNKELTPLHLAAERGFLDTVKYLIKEGADLDAKDHKGYTPLHLAAERGFLDIMKYLIKEGAGCDIKDYRNLTPLDLAEKELAQDPENDNLIKIKALLFNVKDESKSQHREEGTSGSFSARECLPSTSSGIRRNKRNAENECLFAWEDVDEFSEKKNENRDFSKVEIDSEKFVDYVKDLPEEKRSQLIQLADEARVKGRFQGLVNRLISNQKIMSHLTVVERISGIAMHGMMAKNVLADFLNGNYQGVAVNVGFIAGGQGFAKIAEAASLKGLKLVTEGKLLVGNSLRAASPFLARGTSAFVIYDLVNQVKAFKNGTDEALVGVIGDSIYLGVDAAEIGIEVAEAFEVLEGVSSVTGPIGAAVGAVVFFCTDIHMAVKRVDKIDQIVHLKGNEKFIEGLRASMGMQPEQYIEELIEKKQVNNQLVNQGLEYLKQHSDIQRYVFPTGELVIDSDQEVSHKPQMGLNNLALLGNTVDNVIWHRARPDNSNVGKLFCLPTGPIRSEVGGENAYLCHNAIGLFYIADRTGNSTLIALGKGRDRATGFRDSPNIFLVDDGNKELTGGDKDDVFILVGNKTIGTLDGGDGNNTINLAGFALDKDYINVNFNPFKHSGLISSPPNSVTIKNMHRIYGRKGKQDIIDYGCDIRYVDGQGGRSNDNPDHIIIPYCYGVRKKIVVRPSTKIDNLDQSRYGIFITLFLLIRGKPISMLHLATFLHSKESIIFYLTLLFLT